MSDSDSMATRRAEMSARLEAQREARRQEREAKRDQQESAVTDESRRRSAMEMFNQQFEAHKKEVTAHHELASSDPSHFESALSQAQAALNALQSVLSQAMLDLPPYEVRTAQKTISELTEKSNQLREASAPKKKFAFKSRTAVTKSTSASIPSTDPVATTASSSSLAPTTVSSPHESGSAVAISSSSASTSSTASSSSSAGSNAAALEILAKAAQAVELTNISSETVHHGPGSLQGKDLFINGAENATIFVCDHIGAMRIHHVKNSKIYVGAVAGSVHLEDIQNCVFMFASRQTRIHAATNCDFYLHVQSNPIIEHSSSLRFAPYDFNYTERREHAKIAGLDSARNLWNDVHDFNWLRAQHSPNWSELPESERVPTVRVESHAQP